LYDAIDFGIEGVITSKPYMKPRLKDSPTLSDQDASCGHILPTEALDTKTFADAIAPVTRATPSLFVRHGAASITLLIKPVIMSSEILKNSNAELRGCAEYDNRKGYET
jgi:hypothetical protein